MKYKFLVAAMLAAMPFMASSSTSVDGKAFTVNEAKVSSSQNLAGCPTLETPLRLQFIEDIKPVRSTLGSYYDAWRGAAAFNEEPWEVLKHNKDIAPTAHETHVYVEFFQTTINRFADDNGVFAYTDNSGVMQSGGQYVWQHVPELGKYVYKAVITPWDKGQVKSIYLPGRDFKKVEVFHFQNNRPHWDDRNDYTKVKARVNKMSKTLSYQTISKRDTTLTLDTMDDDSESLFLYQKLSRSNVKDSRINYYQLRGLFTPNVQMPQLTRNFILFGGENASQYRGIKYENFPVKNEYSMEDSGSFDNALKIESIDLRLMEGGEVKNLTNMTQIASYTRTDFKMTPENLKACGLD
ncbi:TPA: pilus biosynthesis protein [Escherichia coli]|uniref:pilus biosynthesis protein n=1 Tax=Escherichia coli TaxID=562 RepID=UPI0018E1666F|nr:pilus biosynthesis protein [Escherichia coli]EGJ6525039.1 pilus biosynthesis protein [Escherichia coli]EGJ6597158.1 pilus biosynthesis protein [Escherichia coli]EGJ6601730.1 pilus biosynthesis protein [Escherichia coli]EGJ6610724.1 pilus biosynthesis protein [Escherichia coli]MBI0655272.1 pilus biosynthesis protein [Escherichia coli]